MDAHEVHAPHAGHTGHRWLDIGLACAALVVSCVSLYIAVHHGRTMEKLVAASSWPNLQFAAVVDSGDASAAPDSIRLALGIRNNGVGPARLESIELWRGDQPVADASLLIDQLKSARPGQPFKARVDGATAVGHVIGAKEERQVLRITTEGTQEHIAGFVRLGTELKSRLCYCSVFDECYVIDTRETQSRPQRVPHCAKPAQPYQDDISGLVLTRLPDGAASRATRAP